VDPVALRRLDEIAGDATPGTVEEEVAGWWCKAAPDVPFRRANVVQPPVGAGLDPEACRSALAAVRTWCAERGQRLIVQVSSADPDAAVLDALLAAEGLVVEAPVHVLVADLAALKPVDRPGDAPAIDQVAPGTPTIDRPGGAGVAVAVRVGVDEPWARAHGAIPGGGPTQEVRTAAYGRMLAALGDRALAAAAVDERWATIGLGFGLVDRGWLGIFGMATDPAHRRRGIASSIVRALAASAIDRHAAHAYLQVETDNGGAIACYERLGFVRSHGYHYRSAGLDRTIGC
jgi:ribosomal protein S18 acetylase RimI-like enzyme